MGSSLRFSLGEEAGQPVLAGMVGGRIDQGGDEARLVEQRRHAHQRVAGERARTAGGIEIEMAAAAPIRRWTPDGAASA